MSNLNKQLKDLFFKTIQRVEEERKHSNAYNYHPPYQQHIVFDDDDDIRGLIYFYEWSNCDNAPRTYYTLKAFKNFLDRSGIYVPSYQMELIKNIMNPHIACRKDGKELIIKPNKESLKHALENEDRSTNPFRSTGSPFYAPSTRKGSEDREPYNVSITRTPQQEARRLIQRPPMYAEVDNRYPDMEQVGDWFG